MKCQTNKRHHIWWHFLSIQKYKIITYPFNWTNNPTVTVIQLNARYIGCNYNTHLMYYVIVPLTCLIFTIFIVITSWRKFSRFWTFYLYTEWGKSLIFFQGLCKWILNFAHYKSFFMAKPNFHVLPPCGAQGPEVDFK